MSREEKIAKARELRAVGERTVQIAKALDAPYGTVYGWLADIPAPARRCPGCEIEFTPSNGNQTLCPSCDRRRVWDRDNRAACPECGEPMPPGSRAPSKRPARCKPCRHKHEREQREQRRARIQELWAAGATLKEIAAGLDSTTNSIGVEIAHMRSEGYEVPHRYSPQSGRRDAA